MVPLVSKLDLASSYCTFQPQYFKCEFIPLAFSNTCLLQQIESGGYWQIQDGAESCNIVTALKDFNSISGNECRGDPGKGHDFNWQ